MKRYEEFAVNQAALAGIQEQLAKEIAHSLQPKMVGAQLLTPDTGLVGSQGGTKTYRTETNITGVTTFSEGAPLPDVGSASQDTIKVTPINIGGKETITVDAINYADYNVINDVKELLAQAMAQYKDTIYWQKICGATDIVTEAVGNGDSSTQWFQLDHGYDVSTDEGILKMGAVTVDGAAQTLGTDYKVDFYKGWLYFEVAPGVVAIVASYTYADGRQVLNAATVTDAAYVDLIAGKTKIVGSYGMPDTAVLHQNQASDLLADDKYLAAASSLSGEKVILNGQISRAAGLDVLESQMMYEGVLAILKKKAIGYDVYKEKLNAELEKIVGTKGDLYAKVWEKSLPGITRPNLIALVFNTHMYAKTHT